MFYVVLWLLFCAYLFLYLIRFYIVICLLFLLILVWCFSNLVCDYLWFGCLNCICCMVFMFHFGFVYCGVCCVDWLIVLFVGNECVSFCNLFSLISLLLVVFVLGFDFSVNCCIDLFCEFLLGLVVWLGLVLWWCSLRLRLGLFLRCYVGDLVLIVCDLRLLLFNSVVLIYCIVYFVLLLIWMILVWYLFVCLRRLFGFV